MPVNPGTAGRLSVRSETVRLLKRVAPCIGEVVHQIVVAGIHGIELLPRPVQVGAAVHGVLVEKIGQLPACPGGVAAQTGRVRVQVQIGQRSGSSCSTGSVADRGWRRVIQIQTVVLVGFRSET